jgi:hypothetical protein
MEDVRGKYVSPAIDQLAFNCPHCGALAKQFWFSVHADQLPRDTKPMLMTAEGLEELKKSKKLEPQERDRLVKWAERMVSGRPFLEAHSQYRSFDVNELSISSCFNCDELCIWIYDQLVWPRRAAGPQSNPDLPADVRRDYDEASTTLEASPRGAAALLRLAIQKLCKALGENGNNINADIASLVRKGLDSRVQKALDVVRVIGNNAVHPGQIDLRDDRTTAETLFGLVNLICEKMITEPKHVEAVYERLPESDRKAIEQRDTRKR